jgi:hypothetical protein
VEIGSPGVAGDTNTIRLGAPDAQTATYIAGISNAAVTGADVVVAANGRLGVMTSSVRYKHDIRDMGEASSNLLKLRPVTFRYNNDPSGIVQYGLVAEEVAKIYPELVTYGPDGKIQTVRCLTLSAMLLNEIGKQSAALRNQNSRNDQQSEQIARQARQIESLTAKLAQVEASTQRKLGMQQAVFEQRLSLLEHAMATREGGNNLAAAFKR